MNNRLNLPEFELLDAKRVGELTQVFSERSVPVLLGSEIMTGSDRTKGIDYTEGRSYVFTVLEQHAGQVNSNGAGVLSYRDSDAQLIVQYDMKSHDYALISLRKLPEPKPLGKTTWKFTTPATSGSWRRRKTDAARGV